MIKIRFVILDFMQPDVDAMVPIVPRVGELVWLYGRTYRVSRIQHDMVKDGNFDGMMTQFIYVCLDTI